MRLLKLHYNFPKCPFCGGNAKSNGKARQQCNVYSELTNMAMQLRCKDCKKTFTWKW